MRGGLGHVAAVAGWADAPALAGERHHERLAAACAQGTGEFTGQVVPDARVLLEDLRLRGDRQHPFWAVVEKKR